jgi:hypothetical protein
MWERFELFWTAFEKFALFFSLVATLAILVTMVLVYDAVISLEMPTPVTAKEIDPLFDITRQGFERIQDTVLTTEVSIDHTVPVTFDVRLNPAATELKLVGQNRISVDAITIQLRGDAGNLVGEAATLDVGAENAFQVKMDVSQQVVIDVPVQVQVPVTIPLSSLDLTSLIEDLEKANAAMHVEAAVPAQGVLETAQR